MPELVLEPLEEYAPPGTLFLVHGGGGAVLPQSIPFQGAIESVSWTPCTPAHGNRVPAEHRLMLLFRNAGQVEHSVTIYGAMTPAGRSEDLVFALSPGAVAVARLMDIMAFRQHDGHVYLEADSGDVEVAIVRHW